MASSLWDPVNTVALALSYSSIVLTHAHCGNDDMHDQYKNINTVVFREKSEKRSFNLSSTEHARYWFLLC